MTVGLSSSVHAADEGLGIAESDLRGCTQCGTCSAVCPMIDYMEYSPRALNALRLGGHYEEALHSMAIWACTSCYACTLNCPKKLPITDAIYSLKRAAMQTGAYPKMMATPNLVPNLVKEFNHFVHGGGRNTESWMSVRLYLRTKPMRLIRYGPLGLRLMLAGRMSMKREHIRRPAELRVVLDALESTAGGQS